MDQHRLILFDQEWSSHLWAIALVPWLDKVQDSSTGRERAYEMLNRLYCDFTATRGEKNQRKKMAQKVGAQGASAEDACMAGANSPVFISSLRPLTLHCNFGNPLFPFMCNYINQCLSLSLSSNLKSNEYICSWHTPTCVTSTHSYIERCLYTCSPSCLAKLTHHQSTVTSRYEPHLLLISTLCW